MAKTIVFTPEAEEDAYRGYSWYESKHIGLGLTSSPEQHPMLWCILGGTASATMALPVSIQVAQPWGPG